MSYDPNNPHYDPYTAQPTTGYPDSPGYPDSAPPQQGGYGYAAYGQQPYNAAGYVAPVQYHAPENGVGTAALVLGIIGLVGCALCAIPAIICGHIGMKKADRGEADNRGQAQAGLVMGYIGAGLWLLILVFYVVVVVIALGASTASTSSY